MVTCACFSLVPFSYDEPQKLKSIVSFIVSVYVPFCIMILLKPSAVDGPYWTLFQRDLLLAYETVGPSLKSTAEPYFVKHARCCGFHRNIEPSVCIRDITVEEGTANGIDIIFISRKFGECSYLNDRQLQRIILLLRANKHLASSIVALSSGAVSTITTDPTKGSLANSKNCFCVNVSRTIPGSKSELICECGLIYATTCNFTLEVFLCCCCR